MEVCRCFQIMPLLEYCRLTCTKHRGMPSSPILLRRPPSGLMAASCPPLQTTPLTRAVPRRLLAPLQPNLAAVRGQAVLPHHLHRCRARGHHHLHRGRARRRHHLQVHSPPRWAGAPGLPGQAIECIARFCPSLRRIRERTWLQDPKFVYWSLLLRRSGTS